MRVFDFAKRTFFLVFTLSLAFSALGQKIEVNLGPDEVAMNESWSISLSIYNGTLKSYDKFPEITGFRRTNSSSRFYTSDINGKISSVQSIVMNYVPQKSGTITVPDFSMKVNDQVVRVKGKKVTVKQSIQSPNPGTYSRRQDDFFSRDEPDFVEVKDEAFLGLTTDKSEVYVGEGVNAVLAFYIPENNTATIRWHDLSKQLSDILKNLKPTNCWEENFDIESVEGEQVTINGRNYIQWKIYQAAFYPFNNQPINFPSVGLEMVKLKVARNPSYFRPNNQESFKKYFSKPVTVRVKDLPPHPLKNSVAVGDFRLDERILDTNLQTGQSAAYEFNVVGEGNIASLEKPIIKDNGAMEIYEPTVSQEISKRGNRIVGRKGFRYFMIPQEPGNIELAPYFQWVYFNPSLRKYDTLQSKLALFVTGSSKQNEVIDARDGGSFYEQISVADNKLKDITGNNWQKWAFNGFLVLIAGASVFLLLRK